MKNILRSFIAAWYLLGWLSHVYLAIFSPQTYAVFGETALFAWFIPVWQQMVMPHIRIFALLLAGIEITIGLCLIAKGKWVYLGLAASVLFNLFLVQLGLGMPAVTGWQDFLGNRMPNIIFILLQLPLFFLSYPLSVIETIRSRSNKR